MPYIPRNVNSISPLLTSIPTKSSKLPIPFKYNNVLKFRNKIDSRINILNIIIPDFFKLSNYHYFNCIYFFKNNKIKFDKINESIDQNKILEIGSNLLFLRLYNYLILKKCIDNSDTDPIILIDKIKPWEINTIKMRHDFINQFLKNLDYNNLLIKSLQPNNLILPIKIESSIRHKVLPMLIGLLYYNYGSSKTFKFVDEFVINGKWSKFQKYSHKGLLELYTDKNLHNFTT